MNDQQHSSADALTDASALALYEKASIAASEFDSVEAAHVAFVRSILSSFPVEQPAAAPIDTPTDREFALSAAICVHPKGVYGDEGGSMCCPITHTRDASFAPSPADERAARLDDADIDTIAESMPGGLDSFIKQWGWRQFARAVEDEVILNVARAASANETGAEGFTYASKQATSCASCGEHKHTPLRIDWMGGYVCLTCIDRELESRSPAMAAEAVAIPTRVRGVWPTDAMNRAGMRALAEFHHTRGDTVDAVFLAMCAAAPQPARADAPVRTEALRKGLFEARDAMRVMSNWVKEIDPAGYSWGIHMVHRANAVLNGGADTAQADAARAQGGDHE
ncbi:hypothetical protein [Burkholderia multivorans]|uniref:hypothetical protein n=1 Tax=Burkholderia multivorans TaxID=87883 RepID=UPI0020B31CD0|nr:hypothetical protein [Burkholderia multivorans]